MACASSARTVGEVNGLGRPENWFLVVFYPLLFIGGAAGIAYGLFIDPVDSPWRAPAMVWAVYMAWAVYMTLVSEVKMYIHLFMPHVPCAVLEAVVNVGWLWVGLPAGLVAHHVVFFGQEWMLIAVICGFGILIAGVIRFWAWLVRAYREKVE